MDRPEQAEWTETVETPAEESASAGSEEKTAGPAPSDGQGSIAHRLNRVTRYTSASRPSDGAGSRPDSNPMSQPVAGAEDPAPHGPAPAAIPQEAEPVQEEPLAPAAAVAAPQGPSPQPSAPSADLPAADTPEPVPAAEQAATAEQAPQPGAPQGPAPEELVAEPMAKSPAETEPGPGADHAAAPVAAPPAEAAPAEPAAAQAPSQPAPSEPQAAPDAASPDPAAPDLPTAGPSGATAGTEPAAANGELLTVGRGIRLVAKLCECAELRVEGHLEATARARHLMVAPGGHFIGSAEVDTAEIHGHFEGNLTVAERLLIPASGSVAGTTCYREIVIEAGGRIMGNTQRLSEPAAPGDTAA